jgi:hypothetical protein
MGAKTFFAVFLFAAVFGIVKFAASGGNRIKTPAQLKAAIESIKYLKSEYGKMSEGDGKAKSLMFFQGLMENRIESGDRELDEDLRKISTLKVESPVLNRFNALMGGKLDRKFFTKKGFASAYLKFLKAHGRIYSGYFFFGIFIVILAFLFHDSVSMYLGVGFFSKAGFFISRFFLFIFSLSAIVFYFSVKRNLWADCGGNVYIGPFFLLVCSIIGLKKYDANFPFYNRLLKSFVFPGISIVLGSSGV